MGRRRKGRAISGMLILHKPTGVTSNHALQRVRRLYTAAKAGHTGILDPLATGVLPLCFGEATKFSQFVLDSDKAYRSTFKLGMVTSTADSEGDLLKQVDASHIGLSDIEALLDTFRGPIMQIPPMVSALKHQGQPLYKLARQGITIEREPRAVTIYELKVHGFRAGEVAELDVEISCSKGTYIRSIAHDLGELLGVGGHVAKLHRSQAGPFGEEQCVTFEELEAIAEQSDEQLLAQLMPVDTAIKFMPEIEIDDNSAHYFGQGQSIFVPQVYQVGQQGDKVRVLRSDKLFLGVAEITDEGSVAPRRVVVLEP